MKRALTYQPEVDLEARMKRVVIVSLVLTLCTIGAWAQEKWEEAEGIIRTCARSNLEPDKAIWACREMLGWDWLEDAHLKATAHERLGNAYVVNGEFRRAYSHYNQAVELDPRMAAAYDGRDVSALALKKFDDAVADCNKAIQLDRNTGCKKLFESLGATAR